MDSITVKAAAKVNLTLDITGKRHDGYHNIRSVMQSVGLYDTITITKNSSSCITVKCGYSGVPNDERNIVCKCAKAFFEHTGIACEGLHIKIEKNIPTQAGLGGGSADGAAVLKGLNEMYGKPCSGEELESIGAKAGADIPFCIRGGTVLCEGTGTTLKSLSDIPDCCFVLVKPPVGISTAQAYAAVDSRSDTPTPSTDKMISSLNSLEAIGRCLANDFEDTLNIDEINEIKRKLAACKGAFGACMSGSGSTVFAVFGNMTDAENAAQMFAVEYNDVFVVCNVPHEAVNF